jgi:DHA2 family multidrug resistance protein
VAAPSGVVAVMLTPFNARLMARFDARWTATIAFVTFAISYFMRAGLTTDASFGAFVLPLLVQGVAMSTFFVAMLTISLDGIAPQRIPSASGISNFTRITAGAFAASITTTLWDRREALHQSQLVEAATIFNPAMQHATATLHAFGFSDLQGYGIVLRNLVGQAYLLASDDLFWISAWICLAMIPIIWLSRRSMSSGRPAVASD